MTAKLQTKIGLEIHVQLKTKSKMFCSCDNNAEGKAPNTLVCPVCLGLPGALPVANLQAIRSIIKTGLALNCQISKVSKFDRKHYFYPDLPKGYQISQLDQPFCQGGHLEINDKKIRLNRIHLEEDAGKLIHRNGKSLVDLNRAGTPLMEIVTEPDIVSPSEAGEFLRKLVKVIRDVAEVSDASMEKGHLRCDANISVNAGQKMSPIVELKNINSFKFIEKALLIEEKRLGEDCHNWPKERSKVTKGYNSQNNTTYTQREKEESKDYKYFPEPDLPPIETAIFDLSEIKAELLEDEDAKVMKLVDLGLLEKDSKNLVSSKSKFEQFTNLSKDIDSKFLPILAKTVINNYFGFEFDKEDYLKVKEYQQAVIAFFDGKVNKGMFGQIVKEIHSNGLSFKEAEKLFLKRSLDDEGLKLLATDVLAKNPSELNRYHGGEKQLFGFFMGQIMSELKGSGDPKEISKILREKLEGK